MDKILYHVADFDGPLDLLLQLISKNKLNILDISVSELLEQYMEQIRAMQQASMDVASEFLEMAARLLHMKTVSLLPRHEEGEQLRRELTGQLLEYKAAKEMAARLSAGFIGHDLFCRPPVELPVDHTYSRTHSPEQLSAALLDATGRGQRKLPPPVTAFEPIIARPVVSVSSRIVYVLRQVWGRKPIPVRTVLAASRSRSELVATFLAMLELIRGNRISISEDASFLDTVIMAKEEKK